MITFNQKLKIFQSTLINRSGFIPGFSTTDQGDGKNLTNIKNFFDQQKISCKKIIRLEQIHSTNIQMLVAGDNREIIEDTDGVLTNQPMIAVVVRNADCIPLIYADELTGYFGISHQGWRGSLKNMAGKMISEFLSLNSSALNLHCAIGPAIGMCCYEIDDDLAYEFLAEYEEYSKLILMRKKGNWHLNLNYLNYLQLIKAGVKKENIDFFPFCTKCDEKRFYSRRRSASKDFPQMFNFVLKL